MHVYIRLFDVEQLPHAGDTQADLQALTAACKSRDMLFMLDVVANHVGKSRRLLLKD
jgi:glycosidase